MYSSDTADTAPAVRGFVPPQNDDERRLMRRVEELCRICESRGIPRYTGFLSDREQSLAQAACNRAGCSCIRFWGGFDGAERKVLCIEPPEAWQEEPLAYLQFTACGDKLPTHTAIISARSLVWGWSAPAWETFWQTRKSLIPFTLLFWQISRSLFAPS